MHPELILNTELAWAAGLFDGEGTTCPHGRKASSGLKPGLRMTLSQKNTGPEILLRLQAALGVGQVKERTDRPGVWVWVCTSRPGCEQALRLMWPYLSTPKQKQARPLLRDWIPDGSA
jgi:hypothetical protein